MKSSRKSLGSRFMLTLNGFAVFLLLLSYLSPIVSPAKMWVFGFLGLLYPFLLIINILFVIYWILLFKKYFAIPLIILLFGYSIFSNHFSFRVNGNNHTKTEDEIKVLSFNVRLFDFYKWIDTDDNEVRNKIVNFLDNESSDIVCLQEFFNDELDNQSNLERILKLNSVKHYHVDYFITRRKAHHWGIATFSRHPIINRDRFQFKNSFGNYCIITDIVKNHDTIRVLNLHFESWHFQQQDYQFYDKLKKVEAEDDSFKSGLKNIFWKMKSSFKKRAEQADQIAELVKNSPYPVIVCGDFNDTPASYVYGQMKRSGLKDSFIESGRGMGRSYSGKFPSFRIDYIMHDDHFKSTSFRRHKVSLSDHYPIVTTLELK